MARSSQLKAGHNGIVDAPNVTNARREQDGGSGGVDDDVTVVVNDTTMLEPRINSLNNNQIDHRHRKAKSKGLHRGEKCKCKLIGTFWISHNYSLRAILET